MKKNCVKWELALTAYQAGDLDSRASARVKKHLDTCPDCRAELDEIRAAYDLLQNALATDAAEPLKLSADRHTRILNAARARAAHVPTFSDRVARILDLNFPKMPVHRLVNVFAVVIIIGILSGLMLPSLSTSRERASRRPHGSAVSMECAALVSPADITMEQAQTLRKSLRADNSANGVLHDLAYDAEPAEESRRELEKREDLPVDSPAPENWESGKLGAAPGKAGWLKEEAKSDRSGGSDGSDKSDLSDRSDRSDHRETFNRRRSGAGGGKPSEAVETESTYRATDTDGNSDDYTIVLDEVAVPAAPSAPGRVAEPISPPPPVAAPPPALQPPQAETEPSSMQPGMDQAARRSLALQQAPILPKKATEKEEEPAAESTFAAAGFNPYVETAKQPFSTFAIDVDTASYTLTRKHIMDGKLPPPEAVRTEEIINFFEYHYSAPAGDAMFAVHSLSAPSPFRPGQQLLRIGVKARRLGREENRRAVLTFAVDTSGSMSSPERLGLIRQALRLLVEKLSPDDLVALVQFDTHARLVLDYTRAAQKEQILKAIDGLQTSGSTNLEEGMRLAYESARRAFKPGAGNRVLLLSDGAANLGESTAEDILAVVADSRRQGIFCSVYGVGRGGFNDVMLETLANKGDGSYVYLDTLDEARRVFVDELAATLNTVAEDVKIQVEFNAGRVSQYRQLGYENRRLRKEQFRDNTVDAGEVGSGQSVTALYDLTLARGSKGPLGVVRIRFRDLRTGRTEEIEAPLPDTILAARFEETDPSFQLAACAAEFAEHLRGSPYTAGSDLQDVAARLRPVAVQYAIDARVQELLRLVTSAASLKRGAE